MKIIIAPAKKMKTDLDTLAPRELPQFLPETAHLLATLRPLSPHQLQTLWRCNDAIAALNIHRLATMDLEKGLTPALLSYVGIQYQYMAPTVFETGQFEYIQQHLRILSGFYGILRPFDGVTPYRLEMQARLAVDGHKDLYGFWGDKLAKSLENETDFILNLASKEYSKAVRPHLSSKTRFLTCTFAEYRGEKLVEKGSLCKMARGQMVRWMAENQIENPRELLEFCDLGYHYKLELSEENHYIFVKE